METLKWPIIDFFQALSTGLLVGGTYGLMCVGLGIIFGVMRMVNFAQGDFMMVGMYVAYYLVTGFGILAFLGPYAGPVVGAALAGPVVFALGWLLHRFLISRVTGARVVSAEAEGHYMQIIMTLGVALVLSNGGLILFGSEPLSVQTPLSREFLGDRADLSQSGALRRLRPGGRFRRRALSVSRLAPTSARRCARPPTTRLPRPTWASTSIGCIASHSGLASGSRRLPAA